MNDRLEERRRAHQQYKRDVDERGKPFFPYAMFHDTVMSFVVVAVITGLAAVWHYTADGTEPGLLGKEYDEKADPGTVSFTPRPDWYFYFLFYLLRIFEWPNTVILGTVGIPTICLILLLALPFIDIRRERRLLRRPVAVVAAILVVLSMGVLTFKGATAEEALASELAGSIPKWIEENDLIANAEEVGGTEEEVRKGAQLFSGASCMNCHIYLGEGAAALGAPELSAVGAKEKGIEFQIEHLKCPSCVTPGSQMPPFAQLGEDNLRALAVFIEASKGPEE